MDLEHSADCKTQNVPGPCGKGYRGRLRNVITFVGSEIRTVTRSSDSAIVSANNKACKKYYIGSLGHLPRITGTSAEADYLANALQRIYSQSAAVTQ
jgi:hypothetical protein